MTRAKSLNSYSPLFWEIIDRVAVHKESFETTVADQKTAEKMQGKFYAFRGTLRRECERAEEHPDRFTLAQRTALDETYKLSCAVVFWRDRGKSTGPVRIRFIHRDLTPDNQILAKMLAGAQQAEPAPADRQIAESQGKLERLLEETNGPASGKKNDYY